MKILIFGRNGQVGWELQRALAPLGQLVCLSREGEEGLVGDLSDLDGIAATIRHVRPNIIINAAAYTMVDRAESEPGQASIINAMAPEVMAGEAAKLGAVLVHYSTDYVFDGGGKEPWRESDLPSPLSVYGKTKLEGEQAIVLSGCTHLIFRTSWVYGVRGNNFARTMLRLGRERDELSVVDDQIGSPTGADLIADVTAHAVKTAHSGDRTDISGVYHLVAKGETSWFGYAAYIFDHVKAKAPLESSVRKLRPVPSTEFPTPAQRPKNSRMDTSKLEHTFGLRMPTWQSGVDRLLIQLLQGE